MNEAANKIMMDEAFQAALQRYAHGNGSSASIANAAAAALSSSARDQEGVRELKKGAEREIVKTYLKLHEGKLGAHWLWCVIEKIAAGIPESEAMDEYGYYQTAALAGQAKSAAPVEPELSLRTNLGLRMPDLIAALARWKASPAGRESTVAFDALEQEIRRISGIDTPAAIPEAPQKWIFDPHDIEQGMMLNPEWLKLHGLSAKGAAAIPEAPTSGDRNALGVLDDSRQVEVHGDGQVRDAEQGGLVSGLGRVEGLVAIPEAPAQTEAITDAQILACMGDKKPVRLHHGASVFEYRLFGLLDFGRIVRALGDTSAVAACRALIEYDNKTDDDGNGIERLYEKAVALARAALATPSHQDTNPQPLSADRICDIVIDWVGLGLDYEALVREVERAHGINAARLPGDDDTKENAS